MSASDLVFSRQAPPSPDLVFGETDNLFIPPESGAFDGTLPGFEFIASGTWDTNVQRPLVSRSASAWQVATATEFGSSSPYGRSPAFPYGGQSKWGRGLQMQRTVLHVCADTLVRQWIYAEHRHAAGLGVHRGALFTSQDGLRSTRSALSSRFAEGYTVLAQRGFRTKDALRGSRLQRTASWGGGVLVEIDRGNGWQLALPLPYWVASPFQRGMRPQPGVPYVEPPPEYDPCYLPDPNLLFDEAWDGSPDLLFICDRHPDEGGGEQPALVVVPIKRVYMQLNDAHLTVVGGRELPTFSMQLSIDVDSWTWGFSAAIPVEYLADVEPTGGVPVVLNAAINGVSYRVIVEGVSRQRTFNSESISLRCRGISALLDDPYAPTLNFANSSQRSAQQLMADVLTVNGVPMGWTVDWGLEDWNVPAGAWSHSGSYISALNRIAQAAGGYLQPHATAQTLIVRPRYPSGPWDWGSVSPDIELPSAVVIREGIEWADKPAYNRVYVSGTSQGVLGRVTRTGTAGDLLAPMVTDPLITAAAAARQRGLSVLSDTGRQARVTLGLPVLSETGLILPGKFVRYVDGSSVRLGIVRSTQVDAGATEIWQTIGVETHV